jgi:hypothetical protein
MRDYATVSPQFWLGKTGRELRKEGSEAQVVALYLMTSPHANMLGLYYLPVLYLAHETGLGLEGASKGLERSIKAGFCSYDERSEMVWVHEMAGYQVGRSLKPGDNRCAGVRNEYGSLPENPFLAAFFDHYQSDFHMTVRRGVTRVPEGGCEGLASQDQDQEQEQEQKKHMSDSGKIPNQTQPVDDKKYPDEFEILWREYPKRSGSNSKSGAFKSWKARRKEGISDVTMLEAVRRYHTFCAAEKTVGTKFVKLAQTFLGPDHEFDNPWEVNQGGGGYAQNIPGNGKSIAERQLDAGREQWLREQSGRFSGMAPVGSDDQNLQQPLDCEEWQSTLGPLGAADWLDDQ